MTPGFEIFSDLFAREDNLLSRRDPRVKLISALILVGSVLASHSPDWPLVVLGANLTVMFALHMSPRVVLGRLLAPVGMVSVLCLIRPFLVGHTPWVTIPMGSWKLVAFREGVRESALLASRALGSMSCLILLSLTTPAHRIFLALRWLRCPKTWVETGLLMYRYIFTLLDHASDLISAQVVRLGYASPRQSITSMGGLAGALLHQAMEQADRTHEAMVVRGYTGEIPLGRLSPLRRGDILTLIGVALVAFAGWAWIERGLR